MTAAAMTKKHSDACRLFERVAGPGEQHHACGKRGTGIHDRDVIRGSCTLSLAESLSLSGRISTSSKAEPSVGSLPFDFEQGPRGRWVRRNSCQFMPCRRRDAGIIIINIISSRPDQLSQKKARQSHSVLGHSTRDSAHHPSKSTEPRAKPCRALTTPS